MRDGRPLFDPDDPRWQQGSTPAARRAQAHADTVLGLLRAMEVTAVNPASAADVARWWASPRAGGRAMEVSVDYARSVLADLRRSGRVDRYPSGRAGPRERVWWWPVDDPEDG